MTRWFYTDALEAAYMQKWYGMRFVSEVIEAAEVVPHDAMFHPRLSEDELVAELHTAVCLTCIEPDDKLYVHPESIGLLVPRVGDVVKEGEQIFIVGPDHHEYRGRSQFITSAEATDMLIIQRAGRPFFFPQSE